MDKVSTDTTLTNNTNKSILSSISQTYQKNKGIFKSSLKTLNLVLIISILYYVKVNSNVTIENIPTIMGEVRQLLDSAKNISAFTS